MDTLELMAGQVRLEEDLAALEALVANEDLAAVGELIILLARVRFFRLLECLIVVVNDVAHLFLDISYNLELCRRGKGVAASAKKLSKVLGKVTTSQVDALDSVGDGVALVDGDSVGNTVT